MIGKRSGIGKEEWEEECLGEGNRIRKRDWKKRSREKQEEAGSPGKRSLKLFNLVNIFFSEDAVMGQL